MYSISAKKRTAVFELWKSEKRALISYCRENTFNICDATDGCWVELKLEERETAASQRKKSFAYLATSENYERVHDMLIVNDDCWKHSLPEFILYDV